MSKMQLNNCNGRKMSVEVIAVFVFVQSILINVRCIIYYYFFVSRIFFYTSF